MFESVYQFTKAKLDWILWPRYLDPLQVIPCQSESMEEV